MLWCYVAALVAILAGGRAQQEANKEEHQQPSSAAVQQPAPLSYYGGFQGQLPLQYDLRFLQPQAPQVQNLGFAGAEKQIFPR